MTGRKSAWTGVFPVSIRQSVVRLVFSRFANAVWLRPLLLRLAAIRPPVSARTPARFLASRRFRVDFTKPCVANYETQRKTLLFTP